ncbi:unnamed protein product [Amoebophrya sp. A25]|nr:unnamed protein product [Amoebophrya sp. A25]|eukprot:GSA25T00001232001.1
MEKIDDRLNALPKDEIQRILHPKNREEDSGGGGRKKKKSSTRRRSSLLGTTSMRRPRRDPPSGRGRAEGSAVSHFGLNYFSDKNAPRMRGGGDEQSKEKKPGADEEEGDGAEPKSGAPGNSAAKAAPGAKAASKAKAKAPEAAAAPPKAPPKPQVSLTGNDDFSKRLSQQRNDPNRRFSLGREDRRKRVDALLLAGHTDDPEKALLRGLNPMMKEKLFGTAAVGATAEEGVFNKADMEPTRRDRDLTRLENELERKMWGTSIALNDPNERADAVPSLFQENVPESKRAFAAFLERFWQLALAANYHLELRAQTLKEIIGKEAAYERLTREELEVLDCGDPENLLRSMLDVDKMQKRNQKRAFRRWQQSWWRSAIRGNLYKECGSVLYRDHGEQAEPGTKTTIFVRERRKTI